MYICLVAVPTRRHPMFVVPPLLEPDKLNIDLELDPAIEETKKAKLRVAL